MSKEAVLQALIEKYPTRRLCFIEDRLPTLVNVRENERLKSVALQLVDWGYNTVLDKQVAREKQIQLISLHEFLIV